MINTDRTVITGGSGFIGTNAMEYAIENSMDVINIDINPPKIESHKKYWKQVDIRDRESFSSTLIRFNPTHILHLAAMTGMDVENSSYFDANTVGVANLIEISRSLPALKKIVFTSSLLVCKNGYIPKSETDYCPPNLYGESKVIGEKIVRNEKMDCEWLIVRPTSIWGPWFEHSYKEFFKTIDNNHYVHIGRHEFQKPASFVKNTVYIMMKLLFSNGSNVSGKTYYIADYPWYSTRRWANTIQKTLGTKPIRTAPLWLLKGVAIVGDIIKLIVKKDPPLTSFRLSNMLTGGSYPIEKMQSICGVLPYSLPKAVFLTAKWMYDNQMINNKPKEIE